MAVDHFGGNVHHRQARVRIGIGGGALVGQLDECIGSAHVDGVVHPGGGIGTVALDDATQRGIDPSRFGIGKETRVAATPVCVVGARAKAAALVGRAGVGSSADQVLAS